MRIPIDLIRYVSLSVYDKVIYMALYSHFNRKTKRCFPTRETIASELGISKMQVSKSVRALKDQGFVEYSKGHTGHANDYTFPMHDLLMEGGEGPQD